MDKNELPDPEQLPLSVLIVDDDPQFAEAMAETLNGIDAVCESARNRKEAEKILGGKTFDVVITDLILEGEKEGGLDILGQVKKSAPETEVILMTTNSKVENVVKAMQSGAYSYLTKPPESLQSLRTTVQRAGEKSRLRRQNRE
ncbi:MAG: response regulator, partial [Thermoguttaceae bacterium]|nr:response regulator [Thermoguttaceae bacterium]